MTAPPLTGSRRLRRRKHQWLSRSAIQAFLSPSQQRQGRHTRWSPDRCRPALPWDTKPSSFAPRRQTRISWIPTGTGELEWSLLCLGTDTRSTLTGVAPEQAHAATYLVSCSCQRCRPGSRAHSPRSLRPRCHIAGQRCRRDSCSRCRSNRCSGFGGTAYRSRCLLRRTCRSSPACIYSCHRYRTLR